MLEINFTISVPAYAPIIAGTRGNEYINNHPRLPGIPSLKPVLAITRNVRTIQGIVNQTPPFHESRGTKHPKIKPARKYSMPE